MAPGCVMTRSVLSSDEAYFVLEPFFKETRALFVEEGLVRCRQATLEIDSSIRDSPRHFAACSEDGKSIVLAPELADRSVDEVAAIVAHELGHAADFLYPGRFFVADDELVQRWDGAWERRHRIEDERAAYNRRIQWERRSADHVERAADLIAEQVTGRVIRYAGPCLLQTYGPGVTPRPEGLL